MNLVEAELKESVGKNWGWLMAMGIIMVILGVAALGYEFYVTQFTVLFLGFLLLIGGVLQLVDAFRYAGWRARLWQILIALMYLIAGGIMVYDPISASISLTMFIAIILIFVGIFRIIMAFQMKGVQGWYWPLISGILAIILGIMIFSSWPASGLWVIGMFVAIDLIFNGWNMMAMALAGRQLAQAA